MPHCHTVTTTNHRTVNDHTAVDIAKTQTKPTAVTTQERMDSAEERERVIQTLACVIQQVCALGDQESAMYGSRLSVFHTSCLPSITISAYLQRIAKYSECTNECLIQSVFQIYRLMAPITCSPLTRAKYTDPSKFSPNTPSFPLISVCSLTIHRLLLISIMCTSKFFDDAFYINSYYAKIGGIPLSELNTLELEYLSLINFDLLIDPVQYREFVKELKRDETHRFCATPGHPRMLHTGECDASQIITPTAPILQLLLPVHTPFEQDGEERGNHTKMWELHLKQTQEQERIKMHKWEMEETKQREEAWKEYGKEYGQEYRMDTSNHYPSHPSIAYPHAYNGYHQHAGYATMPSYHYTHPSFHHVPSCSNPANCTDSNCHFHTSSYHYPAYPYQFGLDYLDSSHALSRSATSHSHLSHPPYGTFHSSDSAISHGSYDSLTPSPDASNYSSVQSSPRQYSRAAWVS